MLLVLKTRCRYSLSTWLIKSSMFFTFLSLIIILIANRLCKDMIFRNTMSLMYIRSHHRVKFLNLSRMPLGIFGTIIGSTFWNLWRTVFTWKCGTLGIYMSSTIMKSSQRIVRFFRMLLYTACNIFFTGCPVMLWNCLSQPDLFKSRSV